MNPYSCTEPRWPQRMSLRWVRQFAQMQLHVIRGLDSNWLISRVDGALIQRSSLPHVMVAYYPPNSCDRLMPPDCWTWRGKCTCFSVLRGSSFCLASEIWNMMLWYQSEEAQVSSTVDGEINLDTVGLGNDTLNVSLYPKTPTKTLSA